MVNKWAGVGFVITLLVLQLYAGESSMPGARSIAASYDEGLAVRYFLTGTIGLYGGVAYYLKGPDTAGFKPLNDFAWKIGGEYVVRSWDKFRVNAFAEWREELIQKNTDGTVSVDQNGTPQHLRYNQWNTIFRIGVRPELFINDHLSFDYKFGLQVVNHGRDFKINGDQSGLESRKNSYTEVGVYEGRLPVFGKSGSSYSSSYMGTILLNIGINIYLF
jgi:hypothetical protein